MSMQEITEFLDNKIEKNENILEITFFEVRVKMNLSEEQTQEFLKLCKTRLENLGYQVYFTGAKYTYGGRKKVVESNDLMVAVKEEIEELNKKQRQNYKS